MKKYILGCPNIFIFMKSRKSIFYVIKFCAQTPQIHKKSNHVYLDLFWSLIYHYVVNLGHPKVFYKKIHKNYGGGKNLYEITPCFSGVILYKFLPPPNFYVFSYKKWTLQIFGLSVLNTTIHILIHYPSICIHGINQNTTFQSRTFYEYVLSYNFNNTCLVILIESIRKHKFSINYSRNLASSTSRSCNKN